MTVTAATPRDRRWDGPALLLMAGVVLAMTLIAAPTLLSEPTRDWTAYEQAAGRLEAGQPLYVWQLATEADEYYLYPPGMAALWALAGSPELLLALKVAALMAVASLAPLVVNDRRRSIPAALALAAGALAWSPDIYDLVLGNVMALYVGAVALVVARRGWLGATPLGIVLALAAKPAVVPFLIWLAIRHPRDAVRAGLAALAVSALVALAFGPGRYLEYLEALPRMTTLATTFTGNVGLVTLSPFAGLLGIAVAWALAVVAGLRLDERRGTAVVLAAMLLAQPTIGFNYAGLLFPAMALLWGRDRMAGRVAFVAGSPLMLWSPIATAVLVIGLAAGSSLRAPDAAGVPS